MGVNAAIFESAGQRTEHYIPGVYSRSDAITSTSGVSARNLVILGNSNGGKPGELLTFGSLSEAKNVLYGGELLNAVGYAFRGNNNYVPSQVKAVRVNKGVQSELVLKDSEEKDLLKLKSWDYGVHTNLLKVWVQEGTNENTQKLNVGYKEDIIEIDNIGKKSFSVSYIGSGASATILINKSNVILTDKDDSGEILNTLTISFEDYPTISNVVNRINDSLLYTATLLDLTTDAQSNELDTTATEIDVTTSEVVLCSNMAAFIKALKSVSYIGEVESISEARVCPKVTDGYNYFTGGQTSQSSVLDYIDVLEKLEKEDIQIISTSSTEEMILSLIAAHCSLMSNTQNKKERTAILGGAIGESDETIISKTVAFNNKYVSYVGDSGVAINPLTGQEENVSGAMIGVMLSGIEAAMPINEPLTFKPLNILKVTKKRGVSNIENLVKSGVMVINNNPENINEIVCIRALTTFQGNNDLISCERSMVREDLYMNRDLRSRFATGIGKINEISEDKILNILNIAAKEWANLGYIVPSKTGYVFDKKVSFVGDKVYLTYSRYLTAPRNFVFTTAINQLFETTVEL